MGWFQRTQLVTVPTLVGLTEASAESKLATLRLNTATTDQTSTKPVGTVLLQSVPAGQRVAVGTTVKLTIAKAVVVPPVTPPATGYTSTISAATNIDRSYQDVHVTGNGPASSKYGLWGDGLQGNTFKHMLFDHVANGLKIGSGAQSSGLVGSDLKFADCDMPLFLSCVDDSEFSDMELQANLIAGNNLYHCAYLERNCHRLKFSRVKMFGGSGYCLQLYTESGASVGAEFTDVLLDATKGRYPLVIWGWSEVVFKNLTMIMPAGVSGWCARLHETAKNVVFDGFTAQGGQALVGTYGNSPTNVVFRNGSYKGPALTPGDVAIPGITFENVTLIK